MQPRDPDAIRVFISSTFLDMKAERDLLAKEVFPALRRMCEAHDVTVDEVDLRWGITEQEAERGETLPLCLAEIERCRPFFVCMLGERYGWVPSAIPEELLSRQPWLREHLRQSVTALEIIHGVLRGQAGPENALFYFRDPEYLRTLHEGEQQAFRESPSPREIESLGLSGAMRLAEQRAGMLAELKDRIRASGARVVDGYRHPADFARQVAEDLAGIIRPLLPGNAPGHPFDRETAAHEAYAKRRARGYVFDPADRGAVDLFLAGTAGGCVVSGVAGSGKTSFLAARSLGLEAADDAVHVVRHFVGATAGSADWANMLRRMIHQLRRAGGSPGDPETDKARLPAAFARALHEASADRGVVIVVDAVDQLEDRDGARELAWLPVTPPDRVKLLISAAEGPSLEAARRREWREISLLPLDEGRKRRLVEGFLSRYSKRLDGHRLDRLTAAAPTASPLFLTTLLEELRLMAGHESLDLHLSRYSSAADAVDLLGMVLERWEADYSQDSPGWVRSAMGLLWASRRGLTESELLELVGAGGNPLPRACWSRLLFAAGDLLTSRSGFIGFSSQALREAVRRRCLPDEGSQAEAHRRLAGFFAGREAGHRRFDEMPWHLARAGDFADLATALAERPLFLALWDGQADELRGLWGLIESRSEQRMTRAYAAIIGSPDQDPALAERVALLLSSCGHRFEARDLLVKLEKCAQEAGSEEDLESVRGNLAVVQMSLGDHADAIRRFRVLETRARGRNDIPALVSTLCNLAEALIRTGRVQEAESACREQESLCRQSGDAGGLYRCLGKIGHILCLRGERDDAMVLFREAEMLARQLGDRAGAAAALMSQAFVVRSSGNWSAAMAYCREAESLARRFHAPDQLEEALGGQAVIHEALGEPDRAMDLYREAEKVSRIAASDEGVFKALHHQSLLLAADDDLPGALAVQREAEAICRKTGDVHGLYRSLGCQGVMWEQSGDLDKALALAREAEAICDTLGDLAGRQASISAQATVLAKQGRHAESATLLARAVTMCRQLGDPRKLAMALTLQADVMAHELQAPDEARVSAREALELARRYSFADIEEEAAAIIGE